MEKISSACGNCSKDVQQLVINSGNVPAFADGGKTEIPNSNSRVRCIKGLRFVYLPKPYAGYIKSDRSRTSSTFHRFEDCSN